MRRVLGCLFLFFFTLICFATNSKKSTKQFRPYENDKVYMGFGFGTRLVKNQVFTTPISETSFVPNSKLKLSQQLVLGYDFAKYFGIEGQFTFFPSTVYYLTPNQDSIIRKIYAFSALGKIMLPFGRVQLYFGGGGSIVYTLAPSFEVYVPDGIYTPSDFSNYIAGKWGKKDFFRPEYFVACGFHATKRILISLIYSQIFGQGKFEAHPVAYANRDAEFIVSKDYLPDLKLLVIMITMKI